MMNNIRTFLKLKFSLFLGMGIISGSSIKNGEAAQNRQPDPRQCARAKSFTERMCAEPPRCKAARKKEEQQCGQTKKSDSHSPATLPSPHPQSASGSPTPASDELSEQDKNVLKGYIAKGYKPVIMHKDMMDKFWSPSKIRKAEQYVNELNNAKAPHPHNASGIPSPVSSAPAGSAHNPVAHPANQPTTLPSPHSHSASGSPSPASDELSEQDKNVLKGYIAKGYKPVIMHKDMMDKFWSPSKIRKAEQYVNELNNAKAPHPHNASGTPSPVSSAPAGSGNNPPATHPANQPTAPQSPHPHNASGSPSPASDELSEQDKKALEEHAANAQSIGEFMHRMEGKWSTNKMKEAWQYYAELRNAKLRAKLTAQDKDALKEHLAKGDIVDFMKRMESSWSPNKRMNASQYLDKLRNDKLSEQDKNALKEHAANAESIGEFMHRMEGEWSKNKMKEAWQYYTELRNAKLRAQD